MKLASFLNERTDKALLLLAAFFLLTTIVPPSPPPARPEAETGQVVAAPVQLNEADPAQRRVGSLLFRRGWALTSDLARFGAISAIRIDDREATALSDSGDILLFPVPGQPGASRVRIVSLPIRHAPARRKTSRDSEALAIAGGRAWVTFERHHAIARHRLGDWAIEAMHRPAAMRRWPRNSGAEAMVRLADGRFLVFAEGSPSALSPVLLFDGDPAAPGTRVTRLGYRRPPGYRVTDAALLPDGRLMILNRRWTWRAGFSNRLEIAELGRLRPGAVIDGREIAALAPPLIHDNFEALSVAQEGGRTIVRIASDDNFMRGIQRTLLLEFVLDEAKPARPRGPRR